MTKLTRQDRVYRIVYGAVTAILLLLISGVSIAQKLETSRTAPRVQHGLMLAGVRVAPAAALETQDAAVADKWATVFGAKIHYLEAGSGPVVILLHGLGGSTANWAPTIAPLAQKYRVIVPDQIGFGKSDKPMLNYRVNTLVDFLDGFYKQVGVQKATVVGNSLGGSMPRVLRSPETSIQKFSMA